MDTYLVCQICGKKLYFNPNCPCSLGEHLLRKHPDVEMTHFSHENIQCHCCDITRSGPRGSSRARSRKGGAGPDRSTKSSASLFKTTVESWQPGPLKVTCPKCKVIDKPCIRKQRNRVAHTPLGAFCLVICWPICFLPFLMPQSSTIQLYCRHCNSFLGEYDRETGCMICPTNTNGQGTKTADIPVMCR